MIIRMSLVCAHLLCVLRHQLCIQPQSKIYYASYALGYFPMHVGQLLDIITNLLMMNNV